jgi:hypothetical protein
MAMGIQGHGADPITGFTGFPGFDPQLLKSVGQLAGSFVPLQPGKSSIFSGELVSVNNSDLMGINFNRPFHKGGKEQRVIDAVLRKGPCFHFKSPFYEINVWLIGVNELYISQLSKISRFVLSKGKILCLFFPLDPVFFLFYTLFIQQ